MEFLVGTDIVAQLAARAFSAPALAYGQMHFRLPARNTQNTPFLSDLMRLICPPVIASDPARTEDPYYIAICNLLMVFIVDKQNHERFSPAA